MAPQEGPSSSHASSSAPGAFVSAPGLPPTVSSSTFLPTEQLSLRAAHSTYPSPPISQSSRRPSPHDGSALGHQSSNFLRHDEGFRYFSPYVGGSSTGTNPSALPSGVEQEPYDFALLRYPETLGHSNGPAYFDPPFDGMNSHSRGQQVALSMQPSASIEPRLLAPGAGRNAGRTGASHSSQRFAPYPSSAAALPPMPYGPIDLPQAGPSRLPDPGCERRERGAVPRPVTRRSRQGPSQPSGILASGGMGNVYNGGGGRVTRSQARTRVAEGPAAPTDNSNLQRYIDQGIFGFSAPTTSHHRAAPGPDHTRMMGEAPAVPFARPPDSPLPRLHSINNSAQAGPSRLGGVTQPEEVYVARAGPSRNLRSATRAQRAQAPYRPAAGSSRKGKEKMREEEDEDKAPEAGSGAQAKRIIKRRRMNQPKIDNDHDYVDAISGMPGDPGEKGRWRCTCGVTFGRRVDRNRHFHTTKKHQEDRKRLGREDAGRICPFPGCNEKLTRQDALKRHWPRYHPGKAPTAGEDEGEGEGKEENEEEDEEGRRPLKKSRRGRK
ncbi:hypothetical protein HWV62_17894 [Athelia sp. TMB]|nr:hypothetical protein HWV62_31097 [Athelia sp. TMB]KAF7972473.1 hypothetical protein HWV62_17894 [Athelia sp. TMB]